MTVNVLTQGYWPTYAPVELSLPVDLLEYQDAFKSYYLKQHHGRKLLFRTHADIHVYICMCIYLSYISMEFYLLRYCSDNYSS
jgi:hypothetical protein